MTKLCIEQHWQAMTSRGENLKAVVTRFAPSPNGALHLGHAFSAIQCHDFAREHDGRFQLRIEDIDEERSRTELVEDIFSDLKWLGLGWDGDVVFQSDRMADYRTALDKLKAMDLLYPCFCSRSDVRRALESSPSTVGPDGMIYPGTCSDICPQIAADRMKNEPYSLRLHMNQAVKSMMPTTWHDVHAGDTLATPSIFGDVALAQKGMATSYHLAVTLDDARDKISHVTRGQDLFAATHVHILLQSLLDLPQPEYVHHPLLFDESGQKLAKRKGSTGLKLLRESGKDGLKLADNLRRANFPVGITLGSA